MNYNLQLKQNVNNAINSYFLPGFSGWKTLDTENVYRVLNKNLTQHL